MVIGYDARALAVPRPGGVATCLLGLLEELGKQPGHRFVLYTHAPIPQQMKLPAAASNVAFRMKGDRFFAWEQLGLPLRARCSNVQLMHSIADTCPRWQPKPWVLTMHDLGLHYGQEDETARYLRYVRERVPVYARRVRLVLTPSEATRQDVIRLLNLSEEKVRCIHHGRDETLESPPPAQQQQAVCDTYGLNAGFVFALGSPLPRKNSRLVLRVFHQLHQRHPNVQTVMAGVEGAFAQEAAALSPRSRLLPYVSREQLRVLYHLCGIVVVASLLEGFGFPLLDALTAGKPAVFSNVASLPEVGGPGGIAVDPRSETELREAIETLLQHPELRQKYAEAGRAHARKFSWSETARQTLAAYQQALS
jgi:glycosyltransferase involved in cell wall biosynthesis